MKSLTERVFDLLERKAMDDMNKEDCCVTDSLLRKIATARADRLLDSLAQKMVDEFLKEEGL